MSQTREKSRRVSCASNLRNIGMALRVYAADADELYPPEDNATGLDRLVQQNYIKSMKIFTCPTAKTPPGTSPTLEDAHLDYVYRGGLSEKDSGAETAMAADRIQTPNHKGFGNVLFVLGDVHGVLADDWWLQEDSYHTGGWPADPH
jgi:hypothetical protein